MLAVRHVSSGDVEFWIGLAIVVGCLIAAAVYAWRVGHWLVPAILVVVAIIAAFLLL